MDENMNLFKAKIFWRDHKIRKLCWTAAHAHAYAPARRVLSTCNSDRTTLPACYCVVCAMI
jgi:hypothetical protein